MIGSIDPSGSASPDWGLYPTARDTRIVPADLLQIPAPEKQRATARCQDNVGLASADGTVSEIPVLASESSCGIGPTYSAMIPEAVVVAVVLVTAGATEAGWSSVNFVVLRAVESEVPHPAATAAQRASVTSVLIRLV